MDRIRDVRVIRGHSDHLSLWQNAASVGIFPVR